VAAYAIVVRDEDILLARLAPYLVEGEFWTLPGGGIEFGEDPRDAVVREVHEEAGLDVQVGDRAWTDSVRRYASVSATDTHALRLVYEGWAPVDSPEPRVVEEDGSTVDARWVPLAGVLDGSWPVVEWVRTAVREHAAHRVQRLAVKALVRRGPEDSPKNSPEILLARLSRYAVEAGRWTLPGGGVDHGERPAAAQVREMAEETGLAAEVGDLVGVHDLHLTGTAPNGRHEDFHAVNLIFAVTVPSGALPQVVETEGTTDDVAWVPVSDIVSGMVEVTDVVRYALTSAP
jgi:8-oxo-dGTP diphosphatase